MADWNKKTNARDWRIIKKLGDYTPCLTELTFSSVWLQVPNLPNRSNKPSLGKAGKSHDSSCLPASPGPPGAPGVPGNVVLTTGFKHSPVVCDQYCHHLQKWWFWFCIITEGNDHREETEETKNSQRKNIWVERSTWENSIASWTHDYALCVRVLSVFKTQIFS